MCVWGGGGGGGGGGEKGCLMFHISMCICKMKLGFVILSLPIFQSQCINLFL